MEIYLKVYLGAKSMYISLSVPVKLDSSVPKKPLFDLDARAVLQFKDCYVVLRRQLTARSPALLQVGAH
jgi:hypothetical protein